MERSISFSEALREATDQEMERDPKVFVLGLGVDDFKGIYGTTVGLVDKYGRERVLDTPLSEDAMTGLAIGAALAGMRPIHIHIRMDFVMLAMNQLVNIASKARYMFGGRVSVPIVIRSIIGRSWGQGPQHSQGLHALFAHIPGLKVVAPSTPFDAKGTLVQAIRDDNPVMFVEHRMGHFQKGHVPEELYALPFGHARVLTRGSDVTLVGISYMVVECMRAQQHLEREGIHAEVIDPITLAPLDIDTIVESVNKTGRLIVIDCAWTCCGVSAEIVSQVVERLQGVRDIRVKRIGFEPVPCPTTKNLENLYYPNAQNIASAAHGMVHDGKKAWSPQYVEAPEIVQFKGPF